MAHRCTPKVMNPLKRARILSEKRQIDVYNETGIWMARLSMMENGLMRPRLKDLHLLSKYYGVSKDELWPHWPLIKDKTRVNAK